MSLIVPEGLVPASARRIALISAILVAAACGGSRTTPTTRPQPQGQSPAQAPDAGLRAVSGPQFDAVALFRRMGLLARGAPVPFVGTVAFFAAGGTDSTHAVVAISLANAALTFARENDRFRAGYTVTITLKSGVSTVKRIEAHEEVLVASFRETTRGDESVLYEEVLTLAPGRYDFSVAVRDDGSGRQSEDAAALAIPAVAVGGLSTPVSFARVAVRTTRAAIPQVIINPTASAVYGRDSTIPFVIESYGTDPSAEVVQYDVRAENGRAFFRDSTRLTRRGELLTGTIQVPVARVGIGTATLATWRAGMPDTMRAPMFVGFGGDLPVASFDDMLNYLKWFAAPYRLQALRDSAPERRPAAWGAFVREVADGSPDALRDYFARLLDANTRFREESMPGWMTDRGRVLLGLGRPDQVYEQIGRTMSQQGRTQIWEYRNQSVSLTFYDQNGFGRWRLTNTSEAEFMNAWRRRVH